jgi:hypothetical protein
MCGQRWASPAPGKSADRGGLSSDLGAETVDRARRDTMALRPSEPKAIERDPYSMVGVYALREGDEEPPFIQDAYAGMEALI